MTDWLLEGIGVVDSLRHYRDAAELQLDGVLPLAREVVKGQASIELVNSGPGLRSFGIDQIDRVAGQPMRTRVTDVTATNALTKALKAADGRPISRLTIVGHGAPGVQTLGDSESDDGDLFALSKTGALWSAEDMDILKGKFAPDAVVTLGGCNVGQGDDGESLVRQMAGTWGVEVRAGLSMQRPSPTLEGPVLGCKAFDHGVSCTVAPDEASLSYQPPPAPPGTVGGTVQAGGFWSRLF